jgi:prolyl-tRNA editing enzyme YbaK/EbsC (Cys-tRNA(Pro) deacylase)
MSSRDRVAKFLAERGLDGGVVETEHSTKTAAEAAAVAGCELGQIVKSLVLTVDGSPVLALVAGDRRADLDAVAREAKMASAEVVREVTGYAIGGVCPFDLPSALPVILDSSLKRFDVLLPAAGTPRGFARLTLDQLTDIVGERWAEIGH